MSVFRKLLLLIVCGFTAVFLTWEIFAYSHQLNLVPDGMNVWWVRYSSSDAWGFGPGGNETGIIVYDMPNKVRNSIEEKGLAWLEKLNPINRHSRRRSYHDWKTTPVPTNEFFWADPAACPPKRSDKNLIMYPNGCPSISGFMGQYGFPISFDNAVEQMVNEALFSPGAYYALVRTGILIVIPARERIVYVYAG